MSSIAIITIRMGLVAEDENNPVYKVNIEKMRNISKRVDSE